MLIRYISLIDILKDAVLNKLVKDPMRMLCRHVVFEFWSCVFQTDKVESCTSFRKSTARLFGRCGYFRGEPVSGKGHYHQICQKNTGAARGNVSCASVILKRLISRGFMSTRTSTD